MCKRRIKELIDNALILNAESRIYLENMKNNLDKKSIMQENTLLLNHSKEEIKLIKKLILKCISKYY